MRLDDLMCDDVCFLDRATRRADVLNARFEDAEDPRNFDRTWFAISSSSFRRSPGWS